MPFSRFMERCLYAPGLGYYSAGKPKFGAAGDFVTAPELGDLFAQCVAHTLAPVLRALGAQADVLELGGGSGAFAEAVLQGAGRRRRACRIATASSSPAPTCASARASACARRCRPALFARVAWVERPPEQAWRGVLFANEVIDALPATRFTLHEGEVFEEHVETDDDGRFRAQCAAGRPTGGRRGAPSGARPGRAVRRRLPFRTAAAAAVLDAGRRRAPGSRA